MVRARNKATAHSKAAASLASGETVFDRIGVKEGKPVKPAKDAPKPPADVHDRDAASILITGRDDHIRIATPSPNKLTKEQIEEKIRARNREKARKAAAAGLASGETVFDRIGIGKESPVKRPADASKPLSPTRADSLISASSRSEHIKSSPSKSDEIEAKARARAKAKSAPTDHNAHERLFSPKKAAE